MIIQDAHTAFRIGLDKIDSANYPNFTDTEIDLLLNQAQDRIVKQRYGLNNNKRESFEESQKRAEDLKGVVVNAIITPSPTASDNIDPNANFITLPSDHWFLIQDRADIQVTDCNGLITIKRVPVRPIQHNDFDKVIIDPFNKPTDNKVLRLMENSRVELIHDPNTLIVTYYMRYIQQPVRVNITTGTTFQLSPHLHQEIVDEAVKIALEDIESRRSQTFQTIANTNE